MMFASLLFCAVTFLLMSLFFFNDTATTEIYTLSLHDALPISQLEDNFTNAFFEAMSGLTATGATVIVGLDTAPPGVLLWRRSEEHTSELQSRQYLVCRLLLEKKKKKNNNLGWRQTTTRNYYWK